MKAKFVLVTGGTRGIGRAITEELLVSNYGVIAIYKNNQDVAEKLHKELSDLNTNLLVQRRDITNEYEVEKLFQILEEKNFEVVALVNNAGMYPTEDSQAHFLKVCATNIIAPLFLTTRFAIYRRNKKLKGLGAVVNIGSTSALTGPTNSPIYAATKAALHRLAEIQSVQFAQELSINTIAPGPVVTELLKAVPKKIDSYVNETPRGRLSTPKDISKIVRLLIDNRNLNLVGSLITIDGGRVIS